MQEATCTVESQLSELQLSKLIIGIIQTPKIQ